MTKIMLVEDDNSLREIYEARLAAEGYQIVSAQDGEEALAVAAKERPDLVISDVMMPKISGFEMLDILRNTDGLKNVKVIMLTALGQSEDKTRADALGADRYLVKSQVTLEDIVNAAGELVKDIGTTVVVPTATSDPATSTPTPTPSPTPTPVAAPTATAPSTTPPTVVPPTPVTAVPPTPAAVTPVPPPVVPPASATTPAPDVTAAEVEPAVATTPTVSVPVPEPVPETVPAPQAPADDATPTVVTPTVVPVTAPPADGETPATPPEVATPPAAPEPVSETPAPVEITPEPVEVSPAPEASTGEAPVDKPVTEPSSLAEEEAFMQAQIDNFVEKNPDTTASDTDKQLAAVADVLSSANANLTATAAPATAVEAIGQPDPSSKPDTTADAEAPKEAAAATPPPPAVEQNDAPTAAITHRNKIIQPLSGAAAKPDINALLAIEEAKEAAAQSQAAATDDDDKKPGIDPSSIAL